MAPDTPINIEELHIALKQRKKLRAPGYVGISHDFFQLTWETTKHYLLTAMNQMFMDGTILDTQKHGVIVCLPKTHRPFRPNEYWPLTLLTADYKMLSRITVNHLRPWRNDLLQPSQQCVMQDNNILGEISAYERQLLKLNSPVHLLKFYCWILRTHSTKSHTPTCSRYSSPTVSATAPNSNSNGCMEFQRLQSKWTVMSRVPWT